MALALSTGQPYSEVQCWGDREIDTAWDLLEEAKKRNSKTESRGHRDPGAGGPQYSG